MAASTFAMLARSHCFARFVHAATSTVRPKWLETSRIADVRLIKTLAVAAGSHRYAAETCSIAVSQYYSSSQSRTALTSQRASVLGTVYSAADHSQKH